MEALSLTYDLVEFTLNQLVKTETPVRRITRAIEAYVAMEARAALRRCEERKLRKRKAQEKAAAFKRARIGQMEIEAAARIFINMDDWTMDDDQPVTPNNPVSTKKGGTKMVAKIEIEHRERK